MRGPEVMAHGHVRSFAGVAGRINDVITFADGYSVHSVAQEPAMGLRSAALGRLKLDGVRVSPDALLGGEAALKRAEPRTSALPRTPPRTPDARATAYA